MSAALLVLALVYATFLPSEFGATNEQHFGAPPVVEGGSQQLGIYAVLSVDPLNQALHLRLHLTPRNALRGERPNTPSRDLILRIDDGYDVQQLAFRANEPMSPATIEVSLDGSTVAAYPFERLRADLRMTAQDGSARTGADVPPPVPVRLTIWEGVAGWVVHAVGQAGEGGEIRLQLAIRRTGALAFLAVALYAVMVVIAGAALTIGSLVCLRMRKLEASLAGCLSGMLFSLPAMRYALPGSPPLGIVADQLVFLWAELAVALGLFLFVLSWAAYGPRQ